MKILTLRFKNINSLKDEWRIDFTASPFDDNGLFAITGPTGAGKTTLLDAICIALYHQTPRFDTLSKSTNEIMTKGTGDCMAEVEFQVKDKRYRASWSMRRSRGKADGNLQPPTAELADITDDADNGKVLETHINKKLNRIEAITGLNFQRFTKSMMLSQGQFAAFLNAKESDRAELLEELTGTEIYGVISKRVYELSKEEKEKLAHLKARLGEVSLLSEEKRAELKAESEKLEEQLAELKKELQVEHTKLKWIEDLAKLEHRQTQQTHDEERFQLEMQKHKADMDVLERAKPAFEIASTYHTLNAHRIEAKKRKATLEETARDLKTQSDEQAKAQETLALAEEKFEETKQQHAKLNQLLNEQVIPLDNKIAQTNDSAIQVKISVDKLDGTLSQKKQKQIKLSTSLEELRVKMDECQRYAQANASHESLTQTRASLIPMMDQSRQNLQKAINDEKSLKTQQSQLTSLNRELVELEKSMVEYKAAQQQAEGLLRQKQAEHAQLLEQSNENALNSDIKTLQTLSLITDKLSDIQKIQQDKQASLASLRTSQAKILDDKKASEQTLKSTQELLTAKTSLLESLKTNLDLTDHIQALRSHQHADEPCLLCGEHVTVEKHQAIEHGAVKQASDLQLKISQVQSDIKNLTTEQQTQYQTSVQLIEALKSNANSIAQLENEVKHSSEKWQALINQAESNIGALLTHVQRDVQTLFEPLEGLEGLEELNGLNGRNGLKNEDIVSIEALQASIENIAENTQAFLNKIKTSEQALTDAKESARKAEMASSQAHHSHDIQQQKIEATSTALNDASQRLKVLKRDLVDSIKYLVTELSPFYKDSGSDDMYAICAELSTDTPELMAHLHTIIAWLTKALEATAALATRWQNNETQIRDIQHAQTKDTAELDALEQSIKELEVEIKEKRHYASELESMLTELKAQRQELFGDKNVVTERNKNDELLKKAEASFKEHKQKQVEFSEQVARLSEKQNVLLEQQSEDEKRIHHLTEQWQTALKSKGFQDQASFEVALIDERIFDQLKTLEKCLSEQKSNLVAANEQLEKDKSSHASEEIADVCKDIEIDMLKPEIEIKESNRDKLNGQLGGLQQQLKTDAEQRKRSQELVLQIESQEKTYRDYEFLSDLIGSSDGAKFKKYAQSLTLRHLVALANQHLEKLHKRYLLTCKEDSLLELAVLDDWQGSIERDVKTLSGGESFLVSLSLALSLSDLASNKTSIDSLFLDEGFGTLDADALDTALNALDNLNAQGRTIGVISHVDMLKERIPTQLKVYKSEGTGVSKLEDEYRFVANS